MILSNLKKRPGDCGKLRSAMPGRVPVDPRFRPGYAGIMRRIVEPEWLDSLPESWQKSSWWSF